jgi:hypothetical protein
MDRLPSRLGLATLAFPFEDSVAAPVEDSPRSATASKHFEFRMKMASRRLYRKEPKKASLPRIEILGATLMHLGFPSAPPRLQIRPSHVRLRTPGPSEVLEDVLHHKEEHMHNPIIRQSW